MARDLRPGDHVCSVYHSDRKRYDVLASFVHAGLERSERVLCFTDEQTPNELLDALRAMGAVIDPYLNGSQFIVQTASASYLASGCFDPRAVVDGWERAVQEAMTEGFTGLRVAGDMGWASRNVPGSEHLLAYERRIQREVFERYPVTGMCEFDMRRFGAQWLDRIWELHPSGVVTPP